MNSNYLVAQPQMILSSVIILLVLELDVGDTGEE
jgi:hypothetical protein